jgi:hypothetical protein
MQLSDRPEEDRTNHSLYAPTTGLKERGGRAAYVAERSLYTQASLHPLLTGAALAATGLTLASWLRRRTEPGSRAAEMPPWYQAGSSRRWQRATQ